MAYWQVPSQKSTDNNMNTNNFYIVNYLARIEPLQLVKITVCTALQFDLT